MGRKQVTVVDQVRPYVSAFGKHMEKGNLESGMKNLKVINAILRDHEVNREAEEQE
jgi:hypothetical protein